MSSHLHGRKRVLTSESIEAEIQKLKTIKIDIESQIKAQNEIIRRCELIEEEGIICPQLERQNS